MEKNKLKKYLDLFLFISSSILIVGFLIDYGFFLSDNLKNIIYTSSYILVGFYLLDVLWKLYPFIKSHNVKDLQNVHIVPYIVTGLILIQYLLIKMNIYNLFIADRSHLFYYLIITKIYILYIFFNKFSKIVNLILPNTRLESGEVFIISFLIIITIGTFLLMMPRATVQKGSMPFVDSLFTSTSAVCVTGLIVVDTATYFTRFGQIIILFLLQIGGLGVMTFTSFFSIFFFKKMTLREKFMMSDVLSYDKVGDIHNIINKILIITFSFEALGALSLYLRFKNYFQDKSLALFHSVFQSVSAFCNAGFSTFTTSLENFSTDVGINLTVSTLIIIGGLGFLVLMDLFRPVNSKKHRLLSSQTKLVLVVTVSLIILGTVFIFGMENTELLKNLPIDQKIMASYFQSVTARTAGFNTVDIGGLTTPVLFMLIFLMFVGASPGSTGGGIKTTTFGLLIATVVSSIRGKSDVELYNRKINNSLIYRALSLVVISMLYIFTVFIILLITEDFSVKDTLFELVSAFGTVGLSTGITSSLSTIGKIAITITMYVGRLGPITLALALTTKEKTVNVKYPEEKSIMIG